MPRIPLPAVETNTRRSIVRLLKTEGAMDSARLAERLGLTAMAVRQHLYVLQEEKLVAAEERPGLIGRPAKYWGLTREADRLFPDAYAELNVALLDALGDAFGPAGLQRVLESRCARQRADYARSLQQVTGLPLPPLGATTQQAPPRAGDVEARLGEVEKKLDRLLKALERQPQPEAPQRPPPKTGI